VRPVAFWIIVGHALAGQAGWSAVGDLFQIPAIEECAEGGHRIRGSAAPGIRTAHMCRTYRSVLELTSRLCDAVSKQGLDAGVVGRGCHGCIWHLVPSCVYSVLTSSRGKCTYGYGGGRRARRLRVSLHVRDNGGCAELATSPTRAPTGSVKGNATWSHRRSDNFGAAGDAKTSPINDTMILNAPPEREAKLDRATRRPPRALPRRRSMPASKAPSRGCRSRSTAMRRARPRR